MNGMIKFLIPVFLSGFLMSFALPQKRNQNFNEMGLDLLQGLMESLNSPFGILGSADVDKNGKLTLDEFKGFYNNLLGEGAYSSENAKKDFNERDLNGDGNLTPDEIQAHEMKNSKNTFYISPMY